MDANQAGVVTESPFAVQTVLAENAERLGHAVKTGARQKLDTAIAELTTHAEDLQGGHLMAQPDIRQDRTVQVATVADGKQDLGTHRGASNPTVTITSPTPPG